MALRHLLILIPVSLLFALPSCSNRYEDMLRERDAQLRDLSARNADLRAQLAEAEARKSSEPKPQEATAPRSDDELKSVQNELSGEQGVSVFRRDGMISIGIESAVTFDSGSFKLKTQAEGTLRRVAGVLKSKYGGRKIFVAGHTDTDPIQKLKGVVEDNFELSFKRAKAVQNFLERQGISENAFAIVGYGQYEPKVAGSSSTAKAQNRRVEITVSNDRL